MLKTALLGGRSPAQVHQRVQDYLKILRLDHSTKHIFIIPGIALAYVLRGVSTPLGLQILLGCIVAVSIASANYAINEWLDRESDRHHPEKSARTAVQRGLNGRWVFVEWLTLVAMGLTAAWMAGGSMLLAASLFALQGVFYNVPPLRTKDKAYLDVISESVNNPLRLMIGWNMVDASTVPPSSIILAYWLCGAFLMAAKRLSEYREIVGTHGKDLLVRYRASFANYTETSLTVSCFVYAMLSTFFMAVFLIRYRLEYLLIMPIVVAMFGHYVGLAMQPGSSAQKPEKLFRENGLMTLIAMLVAGFVFTTFVDIPLLANITSQRFISLW